MRNRKKCNFFSRLTKEENFFFLQVSHSKCSYLTIQKFELIWFLDLQKLRIRELGGKTRETEVVNVWWSCANTSKGGNRGSSHFMVQKRWLFFACKILSWKISLSAYSIFNADIFYVLIFFRKSKMLILGSKEGWIGILDMINNKVIWILLSHKYDEVFFNFCSFFKYFSCCFSNNLSYFKQSFLRCFSSINCIDF